MSKKSIGGITAIVISILLILYVFSASSSEEALKTYSPEQFVENQRISGLSFSETRDKVLYTSNHTGNPTAWAYDIKKDKRSIIHQDSLNPVFSLALFSKDNHLIYISNSNGSQYTHLYLKEGDKITDITPGEKVRARFRGMKNDFSGFYYTSNNRSPRGFDLYEYNLKTKSSRLVFINDTGYSMSMISHDEKYILLHNRKTEEVTDLYLYNISEKKLYQISPENNESSYYGLDFSLNDDKVYYLTNDQSEYTVLKKYDIKTQKRTIVAEEKWDILGVTFSSDHSFAAIAINKNGEARTKIKNLKTEEFMDIPYLEENQIEKVKFSSDNQYLSMQVIGYNKPKDICLLDLNTLKAETIVTSLNPEINKDDFSEPEDVQITSYDGLKIPAFLYRPKTNLSKKGPALIWTHGGPGGQFRKNYNEQIQFIVNQGYTVLAINNRGSSGYGKTFRSLDNQKHGIDDLKDCLKGKDFLQTLETVDPDRIGIIGDSYGGYLVLAALTFHPDEFVVGVDMFGISNWLNVLNSIPAYWETRKKALYEEMGHPKTDSVMLYNKSPLFFSENIKSPLMVIQGANDSRVPQSESDQIVEKVRANGVPVKYLLFDDEGHGIRKKKNKIEALREISSFLDLHFNKQSSKN